MAHDAYISAILPIEKKFQEQETKVNPVFENFVNFVENTKTVIPRKLLYFLLQNNKVFRVDYMPQLLKSNYVFKMLKLMQGIFTTFG